MEMLDKVFFAYEVPWYSKYKENLYDQKTNNLTPVGIYKTMEGAQKDIEQRLKDKNRDYTLITTEDPVYAEYRIHYDKTTEEWYRKVVIQEVELKE